MRARRVASRYVAMSRRAAVLLTVPLLACGAPTTEPVTHAERPERTDEERERAIREESRELVPQMLHGVHLGISLAEAQAARPNIRASEVASSEPDMLFMEEDLAARSRAVYGFAHGVLERLQVLGMLPSPEVIGPHLTEMNERYGRPTGVWECPDTGGVPTRRFTWRRQLVTVSEIFLIYDGGVSVTLDIRPSEATRESLRRASCYRVRSGEEAASFPVVTREENMRRRDSTR